MKAMLGMAEKDIIIQIVALIQLKILLTWFTPMQSVYMFIFLYSCTLIMLLSYHFNINESQPNSEFGPVPLSWPALNYIEREAGNTIINNNFIICFKNSHLFLRVLTTLPTALFKIFPLLSVHPLYLHIFVLYLDLYSLFLHD